MGFDFDRLRGKVVVAVNGAVARLPWATACFSADRTWINNSREMLRGFVGEIYFAIAETDPLLQEKVHYLRRSRSTAFSTDPTIVHVPSTSGYGALNLVYLKGAREIILLGYDYCGVGHWHGMYAWKSSTDQAVWSQWATCYRSTLGQLQAAGIRVINASPDSKIDAFEKCGLEEI